MAERELEISDEEPSSRTHPGFLAISGRCRADWEADCADRRAEAHRSAQDLSVCVHSEFVDPND